MRMRNFIIHSLSRPNPDTNDGIDRIEPRLAKALTPVIAAAVLWLPQAGASPIVNGDFADSIDLAGWTPTGMVVSEPTGDFAQLDTDGDFMITLEQTFTLPATLAALAFDFAFSTEATAPPGIGFPDSFAVSLVTAVGDFIDILVVDVLGAIPDPSDGIEGLVGALPIDVDLDDSVMIPGLLPFGSGLSTSGRINLLLPAAVQGQEATLYFDLFDQPDGAATRAAVDNVAVESIAVPAPATLGLMVLGLAAAALVRRYNES